MSSLVKTSWTFFHAVLDANRVFAFSYSFWPFEFWLWQNSGQFLRTHWTCRKLWQRVSGIWSCILKYSSCWNFIKTELLFAKFLMQIVFFWSMRFVTSLIINGDQLQFLVGALENGDKVLLEFGQVTKTGWPQGLEKLENLEK